MKLLVAILSLCAIPVFGGSVNLSWTASPTVGCSNVLYAHTNLITQANYTNALVKVKTGTNTTASITDIKTGFWWFAVVAVKSNVVSDLSNVLPLEVPAPPTNLRTVVLQYSGTLTNFYDVGFFKLRLP